LKGEIGEDLEIREAVGDLQEMLAGRLGWQ